MKTLAEVLVNRLLKIVQDNEWSIRHAAENRYCPYCEEPADAWTDQKEHHTGCGWVAIVAEAQAFLTPQSPA